MLLVPVKTSQDLAVQQQVCISIEARQHRESVVSVVPPWALDAALMCVTIWVLVCAEHVGRYDVIIGQLLTAIRAEHPHSHCLVGILGKAWPIGYLPVAIA